MLPTRIRDPFRDAMSLRDAVGALFDESFVRPSLFMKEGPEGAARMPIDLSETAEEFVVKASMPGIKPEDVEISVHGDKLFIRGETKVEEEKKDKNWVMKERRTGRFERVVSLGTPVNADRALARFELGVLTLTLPKVEAARPMQIRVESEKKT